jgi:protease-4
LKQFLITVAGVLVGLILFLFLVPIVLVSTLASGSEKSSTPAQAVLALDLREEMSDQPAQGAFASFGGGTSLIKTLRQIDAAAGDPKVKGIYVRAPANGLPGAHAEELRTAFAKFRESGKFVISHMQVDSLRTSLAGLATVTGSDELWIQETGDLMPIGLNAEGTFLGGFMAKYKLQPQFEQRREYKNAVNVYTERGYTPAHREATTSYMGSIFETLVAHVAADRKLTVEQVKALIDATPMTAQEAVAAKLFDKLGRPEDAEAEALKRAGADAKLVEMSDYEAPAGKGPVIAVVGGEGGIITGPGDSSPFGDEAVMNSDEVARAILDAGDNEDVKAIVFRVSSGGGSPVASDQILNAVKRVQANGKKVVVSMGEVAASGGYYVAASADAIVASPTTITGSIGIFGGKIVIGQALEEYLGVTTDAVKMGSENAGWLSASRPFTNSQREAFAKFIDRGYDDFKGKVAEGRKLTPEQVETIAKGRVWTGVQAKEIGLVDELGGLSTAVAKAKELAGLKAEDSVRLRLYPEEKSPFEAIEELFGGSAEAARAAAVLGAVAGDERLNRVLREARAATDERQAIRAEGDYAEVR